jgi:hypothetical protein
MKHCKKCNKQFEPCQRRKRVFCYECRPPFKIGGELSEQILDLRKQEKTHKEISEQLGCTISTVNYWCYGDGIEARPKQPNPICNCGRTMSKGAKLCQVCICSDKTIADLTYTNGHPSNTYTKIRLHARRVAKNSGLLDSGCRQCPYKRHVEIAHKKPIRDFPETAMLSEVNHIDNLLPLCPNCHWEYDHPESSPKGAV